MSSQAGDASLPVFNAGTVRRASKRILVTGGAGFIGSHLIDSLLKDKRNEIVCLDNCFSGSRENIRKHLNNPRFEFIRHDVTQPIWLEVDQVYHLACPASPVFYQNNPIKTIKTNVIGTINMLGLAKRCGARFLIASTSEVYGDPDVHPQVEEYWGNVNPIGIRSCYDEGKRMAETLCMEYFRQHGVKVRIARIFNTYGPRMLENDGRVVSNFIMQALQGNAITVYGTGKQTRSFCYVDDQVDGLVRLMNKSESLVGPINIGNPSEYTILQLAHTIQGMIHPTKGAIEFKELPSDDPKRRKPDISKARRVLGWSPKIELKQGLERTIAYFKSRIARAEECKQAQCTLGGP